MEMEENEWWPCGAGFDEKDKKKGKLNEGSGFERKTSVEINHVLTNQVEYLASFVFVFFKELGFFCFFFIGKKQIYIDNERTLEYTGHEQKGTKAPTTKKTKPTKKLPTPQPSKKVYNRMCIINTIQISPSPQIGYKISFNSFDRGDLVLKHQPTPCSPEIPKQAQQGCKPDFFALFTHSSSLPI